MYAIIRATAPSTSTRTLSKRYAEQPTPPLSAPIEPLRKTLLKIAYNCTDVMDLGAKRIQHRGPRITRSGILLSQKPACQHRLTQHVRRRWDF